MRYTLFRAGWLIDGTRAPAVTDGAVLVDPAGRVVAAGPFKDLAERPQAGDTDTLEFPEQTIIPGLIDGHVHISQARPGQPGWDEATAYPAQHSALALAATQAALVRGVTTMRDAGAAGGVTLELRRLLSARLAAGARLLACGPLLTTTGGHAEYLGVTADSAHELRLAVRSLASREPDAIKVVATGGSSDPYTNRREPQYTVDELEAVVAEAARFGRHVVAHVNATEGIRRAVAAGVRVLAHCNFLSSQPGRLDADPDVAKAILSCGAYIDLNLPAAMVPIADYDGDAETGDGVPTDRWDLFVRLGLTGQVFFSSDEYGLRVRDFPALLSTAMRRWTLPAEDALWRVTGLAAQALGIGDDVGTLVPGRVADLVVLDGDATSDASALERARSVFQAGRLAAEHGRLVVTPP
jgi:imidazolonepropionase-like amidohydrolase